MWWRGKFPHGVGCGAAKCRSAARGARQKHALTSLPSLPPLPLPPQLTAEMMGFRPKVAAADS